MPHFGTSDAGLKRRRARRMKLATGLGESIPNRDEVVDVEEGDIAPNVRDDQVIAGDDDVAMFRSDLNGDFSGHSFELL